MSRLDITAYPNQSLIMHTDTEHTAPSAVCNTWTRSTGSSFHGPLTIIPMSLSTSFLQQQHVGIAASWVCSLFHALSPGYECSNRVGDTCSHLHRESSAWETVRKPFQLPAAAATWTFFSLCPLWMASGLEVNVPFPTSRTDKNPFLKYLSQVIWPKSSNKVQHCVKKNHGCLSNP